MRRVSLTWLALVTFSCATEENTGGPLGLGGGIGGDTGVSGSVGAAGTVGTAGTDNPTSGSGGVAVAGTGGSGDIGGSVTTGGGGLATSGTGGSFTTGGGGTFSMSGSGGSAGAGGKSTGGAGGSAGGGGKSTGGAGGSAGASGGSAGKGGGGSGGTGGTGGTGGSTGVAKCGDHAIPARAQWTGAASKECAPTCADPNGPFTAALAIDGNTATRFATGTTQLGGEWLQIDLGATATVKSVSINTASATDYTRHYQIRVNSVSIVDMHDPALATPILAQADGATGTMVIPLSSITNGRYVLISQTGMVAAGQTSWWSVNEVDVTCP